MNIKRPLLIIIPILLLILLFFFICADRRGFFKDDSSVSHIRSIDGIGQMKEAAPGEGTDDLSGESIPTGSVAGRPAAELLERSGGEVGVRKPSAASVKKNDSASVKPVSGESIISGDRKDIAEENRIPGTKTAALKDGSAAKGTQAGDKISGIYAAAEKKGSAADSGSPAAYKKIEAASGKSKVVPDKPRTGEVKYSRLDRIRLYSGEVLTGAVTSRGDIYTVITSAGTRRVSAKDIQGNDIVK